MNLYIRYFTNETLVHSVDEAIDFLCSIPEIQMTQELADDIKAYSEGSSTFPKRYKVRPRAYFIVIKTTAQTLADFKAKKALRSAPGKGETNPVIAELNAERPGWYEGSLDFKQVVFIPSTGKHEYRDTHFSARCKAMSGMDCYNRIVDHLRSRVDGRSQFPSVKGKNFHYRYLGMWKQ